MAFIADLKLRNKLVALVILPVLGMLYFSQAWVVEQLNRIDEVDKLDSYHVIAFDTNTTVNALQKERGIVALGHNAIWSPTLTSMLKG